MARVLIAAGGVLLVVGIALGGYQAYLRYQTAVQRQQVDAAQVVVGVRRREAVQVRSADRGEEQRIRLPRQRACRRASVIGSMSYLQRVVRHKER